MHVRSGWQPERQFKIMSIISITICVCVCPVSCSPPLWLLISLTLRHFSVRHRNELLSVEFALKCRENQGVFHRLDGFLQIPPQCPVRGMLEMDLKNCFLIVLERSIFVFLAASQSVTKANNSVCISPLLLECKLLHLTLVNPFLLQICFLSTIALTLQMSFTFFLRLFM